MINYTDINNFNKAFDLEQLTLNSTFEIQKMMNKQILAFFKNFMANYNIKMNYNTENKSSKYLFSATTTLNKSNENIALLTSLISKFKDVKKLCNSSTSSLIMKESINEYNNTFVSSIDIIFKNTECIEKFLYQISVINFSELLINERTENLEIEKNNNTSYISNNELSSYFIENTLIISSIQGKVILPYTLDKIYNLLSTNPEYSSIEDVINKKYTIPLVNYKIPAISRFKEAYNLMINKEKSSKLKAFLLAIELFSNYNLHPAIITACETQAQLDAYLSCLEDNTLENFQIFNIKFEIPPIINPINC